MDFDSSDDCCALVILNLIRYDNDNYIQHHGLSLFLLCSLEVTLGKAKNICPVLRSKGEISGPFVILCSTDVKILCPFGNLNKGNK